MKKLDEGFFDKIKRAFEKRLDDELAQKVDALLDNPTAAHKKLASDLAKSMDAIEKEYDKLGL